MGSKRYPEEFKIEAVKQVLERGPQRGRGGQSAESGTETLRLNCLIDTETDGWVLMVDSRLWLT